MKRSDCYNQLPTLIPITVLLFTGLLFAQNPVPLVDQPLVPTTVAPGSPQLNLTVRGAGFVQGSVVQWNSSALPTSFLSAHTLKAKVPASNLVTANSASVTVINPKPGGGKSNVAFFQIAKAVSHLSFTTNNVANSPFLSAAVADFDKDGKLDLAGTSSANSVEILLGNGDGTFQSAKSFSLGNIGTAITTGDFNGDEHIDLAVLTPSTVSVLLGNGDGTFQAPITSAAGANGFSLFAADFDRDGKLDLAVANLNTGFPNSGTVSILFGNGDGSFQPPVAHIIGSNPNSVTGGDFNGDGKIDLVVSLGDGSPPKVRIAAAILLGNGDGSFQAPIFLEIPKFSNCNLCDAHRVLTADLNEDGDLDVVVGINAQGFTTGLVYLGNGDGTFGAPGNIGGCNIAASTDFSGFGDFNADGILDISPQFRTVDSLCSFIGEANGTFQSKSAAVKPPLSVSVRPIMLAAGDFDNNGHIDSVINTGGGVAVALQGP
jgi:VCBS repeat protein